MSKRSREHKTVSDEARGEGMRVPDEKSLLGRIGAEHVCFNAHSPILHHLLSASSSLFMSASVVPTNCQQLHCFIGSVSLFILTASRGCEVPVISVNAAGARTNSVVARLKPPPPLRTQNFRPFG